VRVEPIGAYPAVALRILLWYAGVGQPVPVADGIDLYRITYWSVTDGKPVLVSGLMSVPADGDALRGTVLWMHGTNTDRRRSISAPSLQEGVAASGAFAGGGYLMLAPDLVGLGVSKGPQAYLYNASTIPVTTDLLRAAQRVTEDLHRSWNPNLYITGFSQGGHSSAVMQRALEEMNDPAFRVRAVGAVAGAYNLADISIAFAMKGRSSEDSIYLTTVALSYATHYGHPLDSLLTAKYAAIAERDFDGDHEDALEAAMPSNPRLLFRPDFLQAFDTHGSHWFIDAMRKNDAYAWAPKAPFRAYYGTKDVDVSPEESKFFAQQAKKNGGNVSAIDVGPYDHGQSVLQAVPQIRRWLDSLSASPHS
jgi:pimeloyl-ACP methyl ester carboxylesterase